MNHSSTLTIADDTLALAVALAVGLHVAVIGLVHFDVPKRAPDQVPSSLDVILVPWASDKPPDEADFLAQANQRGGGQSPELDRPAEHLAPGPAPSDQRQTEPEREARSLQARAQPVDPIAVFDPSQVVPDSMAPEPLDNKVPDSSELVRESLAMARLAPDRLSEPRDFPERQRRKFISANTREYLYASYMRSWVAKVERVGNLNYPEKARRMNLEGALVLSVDILANGGVDRIRVLRSSGYDVLDEAAVRIVRLSSPFAPLPREITESIDVLTITRTWQFSAQGGLQ